MKRKFAMLMLLLALSAAACGKKLPAETQPVETVPSATEGTEAAEPELEYVTAQTNGIPAVLKTLSRGDTVDVVESFDEKHYTVKLELGYGLVEKNLLRLESEPAFEPWTGYAVHNAAVYDHYRLAGEPVKTLASNSKVEVLDDLGWCVLVRYEGADGYMKPENLSKNASSGGSSVPADTGSSSGNESTGEDGGDIYLRVPEITWLSTFAPQTGNVSGKATVLADQTKVVLGYFDRGDRIPVLKKDDASDILTVYLDGLHAEISGTCVCGETEPGYEAWNGCTTGITTLYGDRWMMDGAIDRLNSNVVVKVLFELEDCYLVDADGTVGYLEKTHIVPEEVSDQKTETNVPEQKPQTEKAPPADGSPDHSSGDTGEKPEDGNAPTQESTPPTDPPENTGTQDPEWTPPIL